MRWLSRLRTLLRLLWFRLRFAATWLRHALSGRVLGREAAVTAMMRADWDDRARADAMYWIATRPEAWSSEEFFRSGEADAQQILTRAAIPLAPGDAVLDIGCGVGRLLRAMIAGGAVGYGVDVSAEMIERARRHLAPAEVHLTVSPAHQLSALPARHFRLIYSYVVLQHVPEAAMILTCFEQCAGLLADGGVLVMQFRNDHAFHHTYDTYRGASVPVDSVRDVLASAGLSAIAFDGEGTMYTWVRAVR